jgi:MFS family permease
LVQLVGTSFFLPMFVGGLAAGVISDRFDRRRTVVRQLVALIPCAAVISVLVATDLVHVWMLYVFAIAVGIGQVVDMTNRRALVHDLVGGEVFANAMAIEAFSMAAGNMMGSLTGGTVIDLLGEGQAYGLVGIFYAVCFLLMRGVPPVARRDGAALNRPADLRAVRADLAEGVRALPSNRPFVSVLGVTVAMNFMFFPFMPMIPVLAKSFDVGALLTGVLASGLGAGMLIGSTLMVVIDPVRRGLVYVLGSFFGMGFLVVFALMDVFAIALVALVLTGICSAGFASVQSALVMTVSPVEMRGRAMGLLSMAIGSLPFGMLVLGLLAEQVGPHNAVVISAAAGSVGLALWLFRHPEVTRIT